MIENTVINMQLIVACVYCGISRFVSITDYCYTDLMADILVTPSSPNGVARKHYWVEAMSSHDWDSIGE